MGEVIERLRRADGEISLSVGLASAHPPGRVSVGEVASVEELLDRADLATFEAKRRGRDRVVRWSEVATNPDRGR